MTTVQPVLLETSDGQRLSGDVARTERPAAGAVAVCHPHPQYGGNRFNPVVQAIFSALPDAGFTALRFDFRRDFGGGVAEQLDVVAALDALAERCDGPLWLAGYSFGAAVALATDDVRVRGVAAVAPPLSTFDLATPTLPTLVLSPEHDQVTSVVDAERIVAGWPDATFEPIASADHFLAGQAEAVADRVVAWLLAL